MLVNEAIAFAEQELKRSNNLNSRLDSEILVSHLINIPRENIYSKLKENLPSNKTEELQRLVSRRVKKEPIAYILNNKELKEEATNNSENQKLKEQLIASELNILLNKFATSHLEKSKKKYLIKFL